MTLPACECQGVLDVLPDPLMLLDQRARVRAINARARHMLGRRQDELLERSALDFLEDEPKEVLSFLSRASGSGSALPGKLTLRTPQGPTVVGAYAAGVAGAGERLIVLRCVERPAAVRAFRALESRLTELRLELNDERRIRTEMREALAERDTLLSEVHHRVRNNLQVITSFLNLQMSKHGPGVVRDALRDAQARIQALALVHNQLYSESNLDQIDIAQLLPRLAQNVVKIYGATARVEVSASLFSWPLSVARASPLALLVTEAVTNAVKHAFPAERSGAIRLEAWRADDERPVLRIADDGVGMPAADQNGERRSIGLDVMRALASQLDARLEIRDGAGAVVELTFNVSDGER
jgi:two-component system, sensor histidine kinase PdtaS